MMQASQTTAFAPSSSATTPAELTEKHRISIRSSTLYSQLFFACQCSDLVLFGIVNVQLHSRFEVQTAAPGGSDCSSRVLTPDWQGAASSCRALFARKACSARVRKAIAVSTAYCSSLHSELRSTTLFMSGDAAMFDVLPCCCR